MKIDCLCITTHRRKKFKNWVLWNYLKQTHGNKELIVVSDDDDWPDWVTTVLVSSNTNIPTKRNIAMATATGDVITWFDDDDWQHNEKLQIISNYVNPMTNVACSRSFFYDIEGGKTCSVNLGKSPIFNSIGVARYGLPAFDEQINKASDTDWLKKISYRENVIVPQVLFFWLTHKNNFSNSVDKINPDQKMDYNLDGESWQQLKKLRANLLLG